MARFFGKVGFGETEEVRPGVWEDIITERSYFGDVVRNTRQVRENQESVIDTVLVQNSISIVADGYANEHIFAIKYVEWKGKPWEVDTVNVEAPRLLLRLGKVYNGPKASAPIDP